MFSNAYQTGSQGVEIYNPSMNIKDLKHIKLCNSNSTDEKLYDKTIRGFVYPLDSSNSAIISPDPAGKSLTLGLIQSFFVLQLKLSQDKEFSFEIVVLNADKQKRRLHFSTVFRKIEKTDLHLQFPLNKSEFQEWKNFVIDVKTLFEFYYSTMKFQSIASFHIKSYCNIRKIFTLPALSNGKNIIPQTYDFTFGTNQSTNMVKLIIFLLI